MSQSGFLKALEAAVDSLFKIKEFRIQNSEQENCGGRI